MPLTRRTSIEFAFGTIPGGSGGNASGPRALSYAGNVIVTGNITTEFIGGIPRAEFIRRADYLAVGLTYTVQFSADLFTWETSAASPAVLATDGTQQVVALPYPLLTGGARRRISSRSRRGSLRKKSPSSVAEAGGPLARLSVPRRCWRR